MNESPECACTKLGAVNKCPKNREIKQLAGIVENPNGPAAISSALVEGKPAHLLALAQVFHVLTDEIPEALKFDEALKFRSHGQVAPNAGGSDRVVNEVLESVVGAKDMLSDFFGRRVMFVGERITNSKPPALGLKRIISNVSRFSHSYTHPSIAYCPFHTAIVRQNLAFGYIGDHQFGIDCRK